MEVKKIKEESLSVRLDSFQNTYLEKESSRYGITKSCYVRRIIDNEIKKNNEPFFSREERLLIKKLSNEINRIGTNVNQIAHGINMGYYSAEDKEKLFLYLEKIEDVLEKIELIKSWSI